MSERTESDALSCPRLVRLYRPSPPLQLITGTLVLPVPGNIERIRLVGVKIQNRVGDAVEVYAEVVQECGRERVIVGHAGQVRVHRFDDRRGEWPAILLVVPDVDPGRVGLILRLGRPQDRTGEVIAGRNVVIALDRKLSEPLPRIVSAVSVIGQQIVSVRTRHRRRVRLLHDAQNLLGNLGDAVYRNHVSRKHSPHHRAIHHLGGVGIVDGAANDVVTERILAD